MRLHSTSCFLTETKSAESVIKQVTSGTDKLIAVWNLYYYKQVFIEAIVQRHAATAPHFPTFILRSLRANVFRRQQ